MLIHVLSSATECTAWSVHKKLREQQAVVLLTTTGLLGDRLTLQHWCSWDLCTSRFSCSEGPVGRAPITRANALFVHSWEDHRRSASLPAPSRLLEHGRVGELWHDHEALLQLQAGEDTGYTGFPQSVFMNECTLGISTAQGINSNRWQCCVRLAMLSSEPTWRLQTNLPSSQS